MATIFCLKLAVHCKLNFNDVSVVVIPLGSRSRRALLSYVSHACVEFLQSASLEAYCCFVPWCMMREVYQGAYHAILDLAVEL